ncbi:cytochrome ubiquinol oxidase subunit II [Jiella sonneratiae]|uniref:Cytochrome ubiquinol oxidase subunit II n=1 Tax=Jiella sonneratiae TaxID=2816856 RepID=A0ABS3J0Y5_9HYPH|nr:cytochrome ubiquinol oxidase subunit II [Jiella sonneratiae]MBO0902231.1 cytochrome ubiquinol oxidase subunit II [Jiella sonneratiae]
MRPTRRPTANGMALRGRIAAVVEVRGCVVAACATALSAMPAGAGVSSSSFLHPLGPVAAAQKSLFYDINLLMMIVILPVFVFMPWFAWRYRRTRRDSVYRPEWSFSLPLEFLVWSVPTAVVAALAWLIVAREVPLGPYRPLASDKPPLEVEVVGLDWKWLFVYPEQGIATVGAFAMPTDRPVEFHLTSDSVMQSFFVSGLGSQIYAMAGMVTQLNLLADTPGRTTGRNTQYNGNGFHQQRFVVEAMDDADFAAWVEKVRADGVPLNDENYRSLAAKGTLALARAKLARPGMPADRIYFSGVPGGFFQKIVRKYASGPMPSSLAGPQPVAAGMVAAHEAR